MVERRNARRIEEHLQARLDQQEITVEKSAEVVNDWMVRLCRLGIYSFKLFGCSQLVFGLKVGTKTDGVNAEGKYVKCGVYRILGTDKIFYLKDGKLIRLD